MSDKETSDLSMSRVECAKCGAVWLNGKHIWRTGNTSPNSEMDLAGLVCNKLGDSQCINPKRGVEGGDTWEKRAELYKKLQEEFDQGMSM